MTKVQKHFHLRQPLDDVLLSRISDAHAVYGIQKVKLDTGGAGLMVEYDATRLQPADVAAALAGAGIAAEPA